MELVEGETLAERIGLAKAFAPQESEVDESSQSPHPNQGHRSGRHHGYRFLQPRASARKACRLFPHDGVTFGYWVRNE